MALENNIIVAHCIASMDKSSGGTTTAVLDILREQSKSIALELFTLNSSNQININIDDLKLYSEDKTFLDYSLELKNKFNTSKANLFHGHALWNLPIHQMARHARQNHKKYIISVHGMLHEWAIQHKSLKKKIALSLYQRKDLKKADCLHATSYDEAKFIKRQGFNNPIAVIPNGINLIYYPIKNTTGIAQKRRLLFLSRIHFQKGIEDMIIAWSSLSKSIRESWCFEIVGNGDQTYIDSLNKKIEAVQLQNEIKIFGPKYGLDKIKAYHSAEILILPSYSENFGMVIAESLSCGVPVITTKGTPWKDLEDYNAGAWIDVGVEPLKKALEEYLIKDAEVLEEMGRNGRRLVEEKYSIESVASKFLQLYGWILNETEKPDFVI